MCHFDDAGTLLLVRHLFASRMDLRQFVLFDERELALTDAIAIEQDILGHPASIGL